MSDIADYVETPMQKGYFYSSVPQGIKFGTVDTGEEYALSGLDAIFTTGISFNMVPSSLTQTFFKRMLEGLTVIEDNGIFFTNCGSDMKDVWLMVEEHWI